MRVRRRWVLSGIGVALLVGLLALADPAAVAGRLTSVAPASLALALAWGAGVAVVRAVRLSLLVGRPVTATRALGVVTVTQAAIGLLPFRLGELVLVLMLRRAGVAGTVRGLSFLVVLRTLDVMALLAWAAFLTLATGIRLGTGAALLAFALLAALLGIVAGLRLVGRLARAWRRRLGWRRRVLGQLLLARREIRQRAGSPIRLGMLAGLSLAAWAGIWGQTVALVRGMDLDWPALAVLAGVIGSAVSSAMPITTVGSFGALEAGWALALAATGVAAAEALAVGFATHLWSVVFAVFLAVLGAPVVLGSRRSLPVRSATVRTEDP